MSEAQAPTESNRQALALSAASQATIATAEILRFAKEGADLNGTFGQIEVVELLLDAAKMAIECLTEEDGSQRYSSIYGDLLHELEFWA